MNPDKLEGIKQGFASLRESVADGWQRMRQSAASALTRFRPGEQANVPAKVEVDDAFTYPRTAGRCSAAISSKMNGAW